MEKQDVAAAQQTVKLVQEILSRRLRTGRRRKDGPDLPKVGLPRRKVKRAKEAA